MKSTTSRQLRRKKHPAGPLSVPLPRDLRGRLASQAEKRRLKMATAARLFLEERIRELEEAELLSKSEEWQRAQAWATWEKIVAGDQRDVPVERFREHVRQALSRLG